METQPPHSAECASAFPAPSHQPAAPQVLGLTSLTPNAWGCSQDSAEPTGCHSRPLMGGLLACEMQPPPMTLLPSKFSTSMPFFMTHTMAESNFLLSLPKSMQIVTSHPIGLSLDLCTGKPGLLGRRRCLLSRRLFYLLRWLGAVIQSAPGSRHSKSQENTSARVQDSAHIASQILSRSMSSVSERVYLVLIRDSTQQVKSLRNPLSTLK